MTGASSTHRSQSAGSKRTAGKYTTSAGQDAAGSVSADHPSGTTVDAWTLLRDLIQMKPKVKIPKIV